MTLQPLARPWNGGVSAGKGTGLEGEAGPVPACACPSWWRLRSCQSCADQEAITAAVAVLRTVPGEAGARRALTLLRAAS